MKGFTAGFLKKSQVVDLKARFVCRICNISVVANTSNVVLTCGEFGHPMLLVAHIEDFAPEAPDPEAQHA